MEIVLGVLLIFFSGVVVVYQLVNWTLLKALVKYDSFNYSDYSKKGASNADDGGVLSSLKDQKPTRLRVCCQVARTVALDGNLVFSLLMLGTAVGGTIWHPSLFSLNLALFIRENRLLRYVLKSASDNYDQLIITVVLGVIVLYWYSTIMFFSGWRGEYDFEGMMDCSSLLRCLRSHLDYGFMAYPMWRDTVPPDWAAGYNLTYVLIVNLIITSIISGIIIDTFSALRTANEQIHHDTKNRCFICNIEREEFDRLNIDFELHIKQFHNMWHYVWFIMYLERKPRDEFTG